MLEYVSGTLERITPTEAIIDVAGLGYLVNISVNTYSQIHELKSVKLLLHEVIREDTHELYGFFDEAERALFRLLIGVNGVGPNTARVILSGMAPRQLQMIITAGDDKKLKAVKGIGPKTAQRIIIELKDKVVSAELAALAADQQIASMPSSEVEEEALAALTMLGFNKQASQKALAKIFSSNPTTSVEAAIKQALQML